MDADLSKPEKKLIKACRKAAEYGLVKCSSGNMSMRISEHAMVITGSRTWMSSISPEQVSTVSIAEGSLLDGPAPSVETAFHAGILRIRHDADAVLHFQSPYATALCCRDTSDIDFNVIPEIPYYMGDPISVPYLPPGSDELAQAVITASAEHDIILLGNHGQVSIGESTDSAIQKAAFFELACMILVANGGKTICIPEAEAAQLRESGKA